MLILWEVSKAKKAKTGDVVANSVSAISPNN
jgi:hypothetical protein